MEAIELKIFILQLIVFQTFTFTFTLQTESCFVNYGSKM